ASRSGSGTPDDRRAPGAFARRGRRCCIVRRMRVRHLIPALSVCLAASVSTAIAQPKADPKSDPKKAPAKDAPKPGAKDAPKPGAKDAPKPGAPGTGTPAAGPGTPGAPGTPDKGTGGQEVQMTEDAPPKDNEGRDENPDA